MWRLWMILTSKRLHNKMETPQISSSWTAELSHHTRPYLDSGFWQIVWVTERRCDVETELVGELHCGVPQPDVVDTALLEHLLQQEGL